MSSSVARGGGGAAGGSSPPIGLWSMQNRMFFVLLRPIFWKKWKIAPPIRKQPSLKRLNLRNWTKNQSRFRWKPFFFFFFLWRSPDFGRKNPLNFGFRPKNHSQFWWRPFFIFFIFFFGDHLILGGKNLWISAEKSLSILVMTFFFFFLRPPYFGRKKALNLRAFREISFQFSDKPSETASRSMKIPVKVVCTLLTLSK